MNSEMVNKLTVQYLSLVEKEWGILHYDQRRSSDHDSNEPIKNISLTNVYGLFQPSKKKVVKEVAESNSGRKGNMGNAFYSSGQAEYDVNTQSEISPSPVPISKLLSEEYCQVLLGEPGAGKSAALQFIGLCCARPRWAKERLRLDEYRVPILLKLSEYAEMLSSLGPSLEKVLAIAVNKFLRLPESSDSETLINKWLEKNCLLILLDGLDEVEAKRRNRVSDEIRHFTNSENGTHCRIVLTSRKAGYTSLGNDFREYILKPFDDDKDAFSYLKMWFSILNKDVRDVNPLLDALNSQMGLRRMIKNPLLLRLAAEVYQPDKPFIHTRSDLYRKYIEEVVWERRGSTISQSEKKSALAVLESIAWQMQIGEVPSIPDILPLIREQLGLVELWEEKNQSSLRFSHQTFQDFFVALRLKNAWTEKDKNKRENVWRFIKYRLHFEEWREIILLLGSMLDEADARFLIQHVMRARSPYEKWFCRDVDLAISIFLERDDCRDILQVFLNTAKKDLLLEIKENKLSLINRLLRTFSRGRTAARQNSLLKVIVYAKDIEPSLVIAALNNQQYSNQIIELISENSDGIPDTLMDALCVLLLKQTDYPNFYFSKALIDKLLGFRPNLAFESRAEFGYSSFTLYALGQSNNLKAIPILEKALYYSGYEFYTEASSAMVGFRDREFVVHALIQMYEKSKTKDKKGDLFEDFGNDYYYCHGELRSRIVKVLGQIGGEAINAFLVDIAVKDKFWQVRSTAYELLAGVFEPKVGIPILFSAAAEFSEHQRVINLEFAEKQSSAVAPVLTELLQNRQYPALTLDIILKLGLIGNAKQIPVIRQILDESEKKYSSFPLRWLTDESKETIKSDMEKSSYLFPIEHFRFYVFTSLARLGDKIAIDKIAEHVQDVTFGDRAIKLLIEIDANVSTEDIIKWLKIDRGDESNKACIKALGIRKAKQTLPELIKLANKYRKDVLTALGLMGDSSVVPFISQYLVDEYEPGFTAVNALAAIGHVSSVPALTNCLQFEVRQIRDAAATALGIIGSHDSIMSLVCALECKDTRTVGAVRTALVKINQRHHDEVESALLATFIQTSKHEKGEKKTGDLFFTRNVIKTLGDIGGIRPIDILITKIKERELSEDIAQALVKIASRIPLEDLLKDRKKQSAVFRRMIRALKSSMHFPRSWDINWEKEKAILYISTILERMNNYASRNKDLVMAIQPLPQKVLTWVGWGSLAALLIGLIALLSIVLAKAQDALKDQLDFLMTLPVGELIFILVTLAVLVGFLGWGIESIRKRL